MNELKYKIDRETYRIVNKTTGKPIPEDEPLFILRAQDRKALGAIMTYCAVLDHLSHRAEVHKSIEAFRRFQEQNPDRVKEPDI